MNRIIENILKRSKKGRDFMVALELKNILTDSNSRNNLRDKVNSISQSSRSLSETDIQSWRNAHQTALNIENPNRFDLYTVYHDALLDTHLKSVWGVRLEMVLKSKFNIVDSNGSEDTEKTKLLKRSWFLEYLTLAMESKLWGHSLIQFTTMVDGEFCEVDIVPREHVKPEFGIVVKEPSDEKGWSYLEAGPFEHYTISVGKSKDLGLLLEAAPNCISKKYMKQFWDEFAEIFSVPIRIGKTNSQNKENVTRMSQSLEDMGRSAWALLDQESSIEIVETSKKDAYLVYDKRMERADAENSKHIFGQTMLMDDGSSRSQSEVHQELAEQISNSDRRFLMFHMNETVLPFLTKHGYPFEGVEFEWDDSTELSYQEQLEVDQWLIDHFDIDLDYYKQRYNAKITAFKQTLNQTEPSGGGDSVKK